MTEQTTFYLAMHARLEPRTVWKGGRLSDTDLVTIDEAARLASRHSGTEVTAADVLRAAARGEILLRAICPRDVTMYPKADKPEPLHIPAGTLPTLPLSACQAVSVTGRARWRTYEAPVRLEAFGGALGYYTAWALADAEPDIETVAQDCRVTGNHVHALV